MRRQTSGVENRVGTRSGAPALVVLVEARYRSQRQPAGLLAALGRLGIAVDIADPDVLVHDLARQTWPTGSWLADRGVVVARGRSASLLTALAIAERFGVPTINRSSAVASVRDKAAMAAALVAAGIPTPRTWVGPPDRLVAAIDPAAYPIVVKPIFGDNGVGVRLVVGADDVLDPTSPEEPVLAQQFVAGDGADVKVYAVGTRYWAVRAPSPLNGGGQPNDPVAVAVTPELAAVAFACGRLFGLDLFGVDCLITPDGPVVVEVNDFPNYRGAPGSDQALADHVLDVAEASRSRVRQ